MIGGPVPAVQCHISSRGSEGALAFTDDSSATVDCRYPSLP
jgi:hypothetical protein